jgi:hypothetical protein
MCKTPKMPAPAPVIPMQAAKTPDMNLWRDRVSGATIFSKSKRMDSAFLTGTAGVAPGSLNLGGTSLLGGGK